MLRLLFAFALTLSAQRSDTIVQTVVENQISGSYISSNLRNVGQAFHQLFLVVSAQPSLTCSSPVAAGAEGISLRLEGSGNGSTWSALPGKLNSFGTARVLQATGVFNFYRAVVVNVDTTNCRFSLYYTASIAAAQPQDPFLQTKSQQVAGAGTTTLLPTSGGGGYGVFGLTVSSAVAQTVSITCNPGGAAQNVTLFYLAANTSAVLPKSDYPWHRCFANNALEVVTSAGAASVSLLWRPMGDTLTN